MILRLFLKLLFGLRVYGTDNLRYSENFFFASNHISWFDPPFVGSTLEREIWFVAKKELFRNKIFSWLIKKYHAIPIDREEFDRTTIKTLNKALEHGDSVLMFPEGTRSENGRLHLLKPGIGMIAFRARRTIIPVYVTGSNALKECFLRKQRLEVRIGRGIRIPEMYESMDRKKDYSVLNGMIYQSLKMLEEDAHA
jgi:1-acyl-sn-glycerol-3-phosphate acyltransferase